MSSPPSLLRSESCLFLLTPSRSTCHLLFIMTRLSRFRGQQGSVTLGAGCHVTSPEKRARKRKSQQAKATTSLDAARKRRALEREVARLFGHSTSSDSESHSMDTSQSNFQLDDAMKIDEQAPDENGAWVDVPNHDHEDTPPCSTTMSSMPRMRRTSPSDATIVLFAKWRALLPTLVEPLLSFTSDSIGKPPQFINQDLKGKCIRGPALCSIKDTKVLCIQFGRKFDCTSNHRLQVLNRLFRFYNYKREKLRMSYHQSGSCTQRSLSDSSRTDSDGHLYRSPGFLWIPF